MTHNPLAPIPFNDAYFNVHNLTKIYPRKIRHIKYRIPWEKQVPNLERQPNYYRNVLRTKTQILMGEFPIIKPRKPSPRGLHSPEARALIDLENIQRSLRRSRTQIRDLIQCNDFDLFGTITFDPQKIDRLNIDLCKKSVTQWLNHLQAKYGKFDYLLIPELDKGNALHFHALFKAYTGSMTDSGHKDNAKRIIYNLDDYKMGFTNFSYIGSIERSATYISKYITKDTPVIQGRKRYFSSRCLKRPTRLYNDTLENPDYDIENLTIIKTAESYQVVDIPRHSALFHNANQPLPLEGSSD